MQSNQGEPEEPIKQKSDGFFFIERNSFRPMKWILQKHSREMQDAYSFVISYLAIIPFIAQSKVETIW